MSESFQNKVLKIKNVFTSLSSEERYRSLIEMGRKLSPYPTEWKTQDRIVRGCQSTLYLHAALENGTMTFTATADALISAGLAALLISVYSGETPETILKCPPDFLHELGIISSLSPNRSSGLAHIHLRMKQEAMRTLIHT